MKPSAKVKQIVVRFDKYSYNLISAQAKSEHRGIGEFVRHATLDYVEKLEQAKESTKRKGGQQQ